MLREETQELLLMIQCTYQNFNPVDKTIAANAWTLALKDVTFEQAQQAFVAYWRADQKGFPPTPGNLIAIIQEISTQKELNENEAWSLVEKAMQNSTYNSESEFVKLPPLVQKAVGSPGQLRSWATDESGNRTVMASNFMRVYRNEVIEKKDYMRLPENLKALADKNKENTYAALIQKSNQELIQIAMNNPPGKLLEGKTDQEVSGIPEEINERLQRLKASLH